MRWIGQAASYAIHHLVCDGFCKSLPTLAARVFNVTTVEWSLASRLLTLRDTKI
jgi:hypothetical protein